MTANNIDIFKPEWLNVVFANRNQAYGAYQLRKDNARTTNMAMAIALSGFLLLMAIPVIINKFSKPVTIPDPRAIDHKITVDLTKIYKVIQPKPQTQSGKPVQQITVKPINNVTRYVAYVPTTTAAVEPPTDAAIAKTDIGSENITGTHQPGSASIGIPGTGSSTGTPGGTGLGEATGTGNEVFAIAEFNPEYPGGEAAFTKFLQKNIHYPQMARESDIHGIAYIQFIVERDGSLTDIKIVRNPGGGTGEEAARVLRMSPHWKPGKQNGVAVRVQYTVPVNFTLSNQDN